jgi:hydrogenase nickel incorporation protein HypA/HybF
MHELPIAMEIVRQVVEVAGQHGAEAVEEVEVQIGVLRQIVPEALEMSFTAAGEGTIAAGARLNIIEERIVGVCRTCDCMYMPAVDNFLCPRCGQADARIIAGNDIILRSVVCRTPEEVAAP